MKRKFIVTKNKDFCYAYKTLRNKVTIELRNTKRAYYNNEIEKQKGDPKRTWKTINQLIGNQKSNPAITEVKINDESITSPAGITETFNNHFVNVGSKLASENGDSTEHSFRDFKDFIQPASGIFEFRTTDTRKVCKLINKLCTSKATGLDGISARLLKAAAPVISSH